MADASRNSFRLRRISAPAKRWVASVLPELSGTERQALEAGDVGWEQGLFSGRPDWRGLLELPPARLTAAERAFIDGPVNKLCAMLDDWQINTRDKELPDAAWSVLKQDGFLGLIIPECYGGKGFSAFAHSSVVARIATRSIAAAVSTMVPNSLGPGELLIEHGTDAQKAHWLPRLARGDEIPCFAMTGPLAGSDAASMPDVGILARERIDGEEVLGFRVTWDKRYITLAPVATLMGLAFHGRDPDGLLGSKADLGITLALIPTDAPGVHIGMRHSPSRQVFQNGPTWGQDVFVPMSAVIGERDGINRGWGMLMEALSAGRSISLPSLATGAVQLCAQTTGAYARIRKQFRRPVSDFEGVQEKMAPLAADAYMLEGARRLTTSMVDQGLKPAVISAISKYHATERMRDDLQRAMDVHGGKAICDGPSNYLANPYYAAPVSITVEGANVLTRSMIIFGQGAIRCHPFLLEEMRSANAEGDEALADFDRALVGHARWLTGTFGRAVLYAVTGARFWRVPGSGVLKRYFRQVLRVSTGFALLADLTLARLGGRFKVKEMLSARFGDVLAEMYLISAVLKRFYDDGCPKADEPLVEWACEDSLARIDRRVQAIVDNHPMPRLASLLEPLARPGRRHRRGPGDRLVRACVATMTTPGDLRERLTPLVYWSDHDPVGLLERALKASLQAEAHEAHVPNLDHQMAEASFETTVNEAVQTGCIRQQHADLILEARRLSMAAIRVDNFDPQLERVVDEAWRSAEVERGEPRTETEAV